MSLKRAFPRPIAPLTVAALAALAVLSAPPLSAQGLGVSPSLPTTVDHVVLQVLRDCGESFTPPTIEGQTITLAGTDTFPPCSPDFVPTLVSFVLPALPAGGYTVNEIVNGNMLADRIVFQVAPPGASLALLGGRYAVSVTFPIPSVGTPVLKMAYAVKLSDESGYFTFFDSSSVEITVKILDALAINGHFWVFIGSMTNLGCTVQVADQQFPFGCNLPGSTTACISKTYTSPAGVNQNFIDLNYWADFPAHP